MASPEVEERQSALELSLPSPLAAADERAAAAAVLL
jgi:hypothetical protein